MATVNCTWSSTELRGVALRQPLQKAIQRALTIATLLTSSPKQIFEGAPAMKERGENIRSPNNR